MVAAGRISRCSVAEAEAEAEAKAKAEADAGEEAPRTGRDGGSGSLKTPQSAVLLSSMQQKRTAAAEG
jgi:hypothetical protein